MATTTLSVVNACLASMGETPLNAISEPHEFKASAIRALAKSSRSLQARGWWYNTEAMTLTPAPTTGFMQLAGDVIKWQSGVRSTDLLVRSQAKPWLIQRGSRLYDTRTRSYSITEDVTGEVVREIPFEDLPPVVADYIAADAVLKFQSNYDGDNNRRQELLQELAQARMEVNAEETRQLASNVINNSTRLWRIKRVTNRSAY
jgi:hypothetical protein